MTNNRDYAIDDDIEDGMPNEIAVNGPDIGDEDDDIEDGMPNLVPENDLNIPNSGIGESIS